MTKKNIVRAFASVVAALAVFILCTAFASASDEPRTPETEPAGSGAVQVTDLDQIPEDYDAAASDLSYFYPVPNER